MRLDDQQASENIEDRRGFGPVGIGVGGVGIGGLVIAIIAAFMGIDPSTVLNSVESSPAYEQQGPQGRAVPTRDAMEQFVAKVLGSTEDVWDEVFSQHGREYRKPTLVLYTGSTRTACGVGQMAMGPFYCPNDEKVYIDLSFYQELRSRFHAPGDFAQAYVVAHEVGHHVQKQLGIMQKLQQLQGRVSRADYNRASVRIELQADCFAGVWGNHAQSRNLLDPGDVDEALNAASQIGDDRLERQAQGYVVPDSFTHGTSEQRVRWFKRGMERGRIEDCDTLSAQDL
ncbi:MAG: neutral zinc metallopeptidase [Bacillota bacterium]